MPKNFVGEPFCAVFQTFPVAKKIMSNRGGGGFLSRFYFKNFLSHSADKFRRKILYCCNNFAYRKVWLRGGEYQGFSSKFFCLIVAKNFVGELLCNVFQSFSGSEKDFE